ncbi:hypothetical protein [Krasilnikovia sp. M28-CT-15]|uniref:hypothetical protein n=1 Tax=Krasilnikovia sp. M28-CT-15 TaxID=3373540 RepID=UPI003876FB9C
MPAVTEATEIAPALCAPTHGVPEGRTVAAGDGEPGVADAAGLGLDVVGVLDAVDVGDAPGLAPVATTIQLCPGGVAAGAGACVGEP